MLTVLPIFLREFTEAVAGCMVLARDKRSQRQVWLGAIAGIIASIALGVGLHLAVQEADATWVPFEGGLAIFAAFFLLGLGAYHLLRRRYLPLSAGHISGPVRSAQLVAFFLCLREGAEFVIFSLGRTWGEVVLAVIVGTAILAVPLKVLGPKLMRQRYTNLMNWALVVFGAWLVYNASEPAEEAHWPKWVVPTSEAIYLAAVVVVVVIWLSRHKSPHPA